MLANDAGAALEGVGLDSYVGFLHRDRPGRQSLALVDGRASTGHGRPHGSVHQYQENQGQ